MTGETSSPITQPQVEYDEFGFVENYVCPRCGDKLELDHVDDIETKWFKCEKCGEQTSKPKSAERQEWEEEIKPTVLAHLNMIEDPALAGKDIVVEAVVSSTSTAYLVPRALEIEYEETKGDFDGFNVAIQKEDPVNIKFVRINDEIKDRRLKRLYARGMKVTKIQELAHRTIYRIRIRPPVFTLEKRGEKIVDERGFEYKAYDVYVVAENEITFQPSSLIRLEGICVPNPRTQKTTLLIYKIQFPEEVRLFDVNKLGRLKKKFQDKTVEERFEWILINFEKYSQVVGRRNLAKGGLLGYFTPTWIRFNREIQKGWGNILFIGDTTTAKTETLRKLIRLLNAGMLVTAETASTVGLTGTATQVEKEGWFVDWGFLVLLDRKLLAVDGAHKLSLSNWAALAESERTGVVAIAKAAKDTAYARTRQIKVANPIDREEANKYSTKTLASFLYPCQALATVFDKTSIARLDLAVFSDQRDVAAEDINKTLEGNYDEELWLLGEALKWCWSDQAEIRFTDKAVKTLLEEATNLYNSFFTESIPLVSIDMKWKLARLSSALAYLTLSTDDFKTVIVTEKHVEEVVNFLKDEYSKTGLNALAQENRFERITLEDVNLIIATIAYATGMKVSTIEELFNFIVIQGRVTRDQIRTKFDLSENKQLRPLLAVLSNERLVRSGKGLYPTTKLVEAFKVLKSSRLSTLSRFQKNPQTFLKNEPKLKNKNIGGSASNIDNLDNLDMDVEIKEKNLEKRVDTPQQLGAVSNSVTNIDIQTVLSVPDLKPVTRGNCPICKKRDVSLGQQVLFYDDSRYDAVCMDCGGRLKEELQKRDEVT